MLIKVYGQLWNPDIVDWGGRGRGLKGSLVGRVIHNGTKRDVNFWEQVGIYVLYDNFRPVYVGKATSDRLGKRLREHLSDRFAGRWDMFSWYGFKNLTKTGKVQSKAATRHVTPAALAATLEAFGIDVSDASLNRRREQLPEVLEAIQKKGKPKAIRHYLESLVEDMEELKSRIPKAKKKTTK